MASVEVAPREPGGQVAEAEPLDEASARELTDRIRGAVDVLWVLISRAHAGRAWISLGYGSWAEYVEAEFDISRSRSYQLLDQARVVREIEAAVPDGTRVHVTESAARDLKGALDDVLPEIRERTRGLDPEAAEVVVEEIIDEQRERVREPHDDASGYDASGYDASGYEADEYDEEEPPAPDDPYAGLPAPPAAPDDIDIAAIRSAVNLAHDLYASLSALAGMPEDLTAVVSVVPKERVAQVDGNLDRALARLQHFADLWHARPDAGA